MRKLTILLALMCLAPALASASGGLGLHWDLCGEGGGAMTRTFACDTNDGAPFTLVASVVAPAALPKLAGVAAVVDVCLSGGDIPPWWQVAAGQCREGAIVPSFAAAGLASGCTDLWQGTPAAQVYQVFENSIGAHVVRVAAGAAVAAGSEVAVFADGAERFAFLIDIARAKTAGSGACSGCATAAFIAFQRCQLVQADGLGDYELTEPAGSQTVTWNGASVPDCWYIPAVNRSWGAIKSLYR